MENGRILNWKKDGEHCRVCGNSQFTVLDFANSNGHAEMKVCDCCRMTYTIDSKNREEDTANIQGFINQKVYFEMLANGTLDIEILQKHDDFLLN